MPALFRGALAAATLLAWMAVSPGVCSAEGLRLTERKVSGKSLGASQATGARPLSAAACVSAPIACNATVTGTLTTDDCDLGDDTFYDVWTFEGTAGQTVQITMMAGFDTWLHLLNPAGETVEEDDDSGGGPDGTDSRITFTLDVSGTWTIWANSFDTATGQYTLELQCSSVVPPPSCTPNSTTLCLNGGRFRVRVEWRVPTQGTSGIGQAVHLTTDTGYFWFFSSNNVELVIKVVDGRAVNQHFWVFYGALSDVEYTITVTDTVGGAVKTYFNSQGNLASVADAAAFPAGAGGVAPAAAPPAAVTMEEFVREESRKLSRLVAPTEAAVCLSDSTTLCLNNGRFQVRVAWRVPTQGTSGTGQAVPLTSDTGHFWFFSANNIELVIKVVDGRAVNGFFWVFYGALSDVEYTITVTDDNTGAVRTYTNSQGRLASVADTAAFP